MKPHTLIGVLFIILMLTAPAIFLISNLNLMATRGETVTKIRSGETPPNRISVSLGNGLVVFKNNDTVSGWRLIVEYDKNREGPEINFSNGELAIKLKDGKIIVDYNSTRGIKVNIMNGLLTVINVGTNLSINGSILNGNANFVLLESNITIGFKLINGGVTLNSVSTNLTGYLEVTNGRLNTILEPLNGGTVNYSVDNGEAIIYSSNFNITSTKTKNGEFGTIYKEGDSLNITMHVTNGSLTVIIVPLKVTEEEQ